MLTTGLRRQKLWRQITLAHIDRKLGADASPASGRASRAARARRRPSPDMGALRPLTRVGIGGSASGTPFHDHELALNLVVAGRKRWLIARPDSQPPEPGSTAAPDAGRERAWAELSEAVREHWQTLGWTERAWSGDDPPPESESQDWEELTAPQLDAAIALGYTERSWADADEALLTEEEEHRIQELVEDDGAPGSEGGSAEDWQRREAEGSAWRCTQQPGEAVFVPESFLHATINVEEGLAVAVQVRPQRDLFR